jgi:O-antigen ligase
MKLGYLVILGIFEAFILLSLLNASSLSLSLYKYIIFILGVGLFFIISQFNYNKIKLIYSFLSGLALSCLLGLWQFFTQSAFACKYLGLASHAPEILGDSVVSNIFGRFLRPYGSFDHPNIFGAVAVLGVILSIYLLIKQQSKNSFWHYCFLILFSWSVFLSFSKSAYLALLLGLLIIFFAYRRDYKNIFNYNRIMALILGLSCLVIILQIYPLVRNRFILENSLESKSFSERVDYTKQALLISKNNYFLGEGIGNYNLAAVKLSPNLPAWSYQPVHNFFLLISSELGFFALATFIFFLYLLMKRKRNIWSWALFLPLLIFMLFDHWLWTLHFGILYSWLQLGLIEKEL